MVRAGYCVGFLLLVILVSCPGPAEAQPYGAIAYDGKTGSWGYAYNHASQQRANASAMRECQKHAKGCDIVVRFWGETCAAYATGNGTAAGWGTGSTQGLAKRKAVSACTSQGKGCEARVWSCNDRGTAGNEAFTPTERCQPWSHRFPNCL